MARKRSGIGAWAWGVAVAIAALLVALSLRSVYTHGRTPGLEGQLAVRAFEVARASFARGDGFPLWDRSQCGGAPYLGNPDTPVLGALFAGLFRVPGDAMVRGYLLLAAFLAITGGYAWGRRALLLDRLPSFLVGVVFATSGAVAFHGNYRVHFAAIALLPWVLALARMAERDLRMALLAGLAFGTIGLEGGLYPLAFSTIALLVVELTRLPSREAGPARTSAALGVTFAIGLSFAAVKLVPMSELLALHPRRFVERDAPLWPQFFAMLGESELGRPAGVAYSADEYRGFVGPLVIGMAIAGAGAALLLKPRRWDVVVLLLAALVLARGAFGPFAPYTLLTKLPLFGQLNVPSRWVLVLDLAAAGCAAVALHEGMRAVKKPMLVGILIVVGGLAGWVPFAAAKKLWVDLPQQAPLPAEVPPARAYHLEPAIDDLARKAENPMRNLGTDSCYSLSLDLPAPRGLHMGDVPQVWIDNGTVTNVKVTQNGYELDVDARGPTAVHFNQTFSPDTVTNVGRVAKSAGLMLDVTVPAGHQHLVVRHHPRGLWVGVVLSVLALLTSIGLPIALRRPARLGRGGEAR